VQKNFVTTDTLAKSPDNTLPPFNFCNYRIDPEGERVCPLYKKSLEGERDTCSKSLVLKLNGTLCSKLKAKKMRSINFNSLDI
jgi:hypothetical protein